MAESVLAKMAVEISGNTANFAKSLNAAQKDMKSFTSGIGSLAKTIGGAFAAKEIAEFGFEVSKLAGEAEGVKGAFDKLPDSIRLMGELKSATSGTVSELDLMKRTVQASNFGISLQALPKLLEFAAVRAQQTGQSVDYLVDSIVTGIGRKSPLILDNLGISAVALKDKMNGVSIATADVGQVAEAVGRIAAENLETMGSLAENTAIKTQRLSASWDNFKVSLGNVVNQTGLVDKSLNMLTNTLNALGGDEFTKGINELIANMGKGSEILDSFAAAGGKIDLSWQELMAKGFLRNEEAAKKYEKILADIAKRQKDLKLASESIDPLTGLPSTGGKAFDSSSVQKQVDTLEVLKERLKDLNTAFEDIAVTDQKALASKGQEIIAIGKQIEALEKLRKARKDSADALAPDSIGFYRKQISDLNTELEKTNSTDSSRIRILSAQISGYNQAIQKIEALKKSMAGIDVAFKVPDVKALLDPISRITRTAGALRFDVDIKLSDQVKERFEKGLKGIADKAKQAAAGIKNTFEGIDLSPFLSSALSGMAHSIGESIVATDDYKAKIAELNREISRTNASDVDRLAILKAQRAEYENAVNNDFGKRLLGIVGGVLTQFGEMLITVGVGLIALDKAFKSMNGYVAIAAGVALVALGAWASAKTKSMGGGGGAGSFSAGGGGGSSSNPAERFMPGSTEQIVLVQGNIKADGRELALVLNQVNRDRQRGG